MPTSDDALCPPTDAPEPTPRAAGKRSAGPGSLLSLDLASSHARLVPSEGETPAGETTEDLVTYWESLRRGRLFPSFLDLDPKRLEYQWPYAVLLRRTADPCLLDVEKVYGVSTVGGVALTRQSAFGSDDSSVTAIWTLDLGRKAVERRAPLEEIEYLTIRGRRGTYRGLALPLSPNDRDIDYVLTYIAEQPQRS